MKKSKIIFGILMLAALGGALFLVNQNQEMRKGAAFANTILKLLPSEKIVANVGESFSVHLQYITDGDAKLYNIDTVICYDPKLELLASESKGNAELGYGNLIINDISSDEQIGELTRSTVGAPKCSRVIALKEVSNLNLAASSGEVAVLKFRSSIVGSGNIEIDKDKSKATGENPNSETDKWITVTAVEGTSYETTGITECETDSDCPTGYFCFTEEPPVVDCPEGAQCSIAAPRKYCKKIEVDLTPTDPPITGDEPILNFKISFGNVRVADGKCAVNWPLQVIVLSNGETKVYTGVMANLVSSSGSLNVYQGSLPLTGFNHLTNVAVFIKGPKHLQMKYAKQDQVDAYDQAGGSLTLTTSAATSPLYDFTGYPMLAGDVVGKDVDSPPNGEINGVDFAYVKSRSLLHTTVAEGGYLKADLDGNCQEGSNDVTVLKLSLSKKQGELY